MLAAAIDFARRKIAASRVHESCVRRSGSRTSQFWDSKFHFNYWRPYTAIRDAERDSNAQTTIDPQWNSLRPAPPLREYVSAHAAACASTFRVLEEFFPRREGR